MARRPRLCSPSGVIGALAALSLAGCAAPDRGTRGATGPIVIDGSFADWAPSTGMHADPDWLWIRLHTDDEVTLQASRETYSLLIDADADASTGMAWSLGGAGLGADLELQFSPVDERPGRGPAGGVGVFLHGADGSRTQVNHADVDLIFAPTYAAKDFELRLSRHALAALGLEAPAGSRVLSGARVLDADAKTVGASAATGTTVPALSPASPLADVAIPAHGAGRIRVMSLNVLFTSPLENPAPFARLLATLEPDVLLIQEWEKTGADGIIAWLDEHAPLSDAGWSVMTSEGWGVAIASPFPMERLGPERLDRPSGARGDDRDGDHAVRFVGAVVRTPAGPVAASAIHLKCCGGPNSREDATRMLEAKAINDALNVAYDAPGAPLIRVVGGDFNLVATRPPLDVLRAGLDADGSDLEPAPTRVLGDAAFYTWTDAGNRYAPGRLDWLVVSDATAGIVRSFALDTARLSPEACRRAGLEPTDSRATDHLALVVDLEPLEGTPR